MITESKITDFFCIADDLPQFGIRIVHKKVGSLTNILYLYIRKSISYKYI